MKSQACVFADLFLLKQFTCVRDGSGILFFLNNVDLEDEFLFSIQF